MAATNLGTAYIKIVPRMDGIQSSIANAVKGATKSASGVSTASVAVGTLISKGISTAVGAVSNSIDGAIRRTDILNNFTNVMGNMGISANDAQKSINKLVNKLDGLPTALQDGALAVQRFTSKNGDVKKSTDIFIALNNALLAGGASTELQATALEQLSQAYTKGKPDMMEWRSMQQAMPAQLRQIAKAMGYGEDGVQKLGEALRKGNVSMDDFMDTIIKLNTKGTDGFASFETQAKSSTAGIGTAMKNVQNRIEKAISTIIQAFGAKDISDAVNQFSSSFAGIADWIGQNIVPIIKNTLIPVMSGVLNVVKNIVEFIAQNQWVQNTLMGIVGAMLAFKAVETVKTVVVGVIGSVVDLAKNVATAATSFGSATANVAKFMTSLGPVGLAGAVGVATAAIVGIQAAIVGSEIDTIRATTAAREYARTHYDIKQAAESAKKAQDLLRQSVEELKTAEDAATNAEIAAIQARKDQATYLEEMNQLKKEGKEKTDEYRLAELRYTQALAQEKQANNELKAAQEEVASTKQEIDDLNSSNIYKANLVIGNLMKEAGEYGNLAAQLDALKGKTLTYKDEQGNMVTASLEKSKEMVEGLAQQLSQGNETWKAIVDTAKREGISFAEAASKYGQLAGEKAIGNFTQGARGNLSMVSSTGKEVVDKLKTELQKGNPAAYDVGKNITQGAANGIIDSAATGSLWSRARSIISATIAKMKAAADEHSPSKATAEIGKFLSLGLAKGIDDYADEAVESAENMTERTLSAMNTGFNANQAISQLQPYTALTGAQNGSGGQVTQYNTFNQVDTNLDMQEISKRLGWQVATAI